MTATTASTSSSTTARSETRSPAGFAIAFRQQMYLLGRSGRWAALLLALALVVIGMARNEMEGGGWTRHGIVTATMIALAAPPTWALAVWYGEWPQRRSWHWSLPVARAANDLARVLAGAIFLMIAWAAMGVALAVGLLPAEPASSNAAMWTTFVLAPLVLYFLATPFVLWSDSYAIRWIVGAIFAGGICAGLDVPLGRTVFLAIFEGRYGVEKAIFGGFLHEPGVTDIPRVVGPLWLAIGVASTLFAALWRPADLARLFRGDRRG